MDLLSFVKRRALIDNKTLTAIVNEQIRSRISFYEELYFHGSKYKIPESDVIEWALDCSEGKLTQITTTKGIVDCYKDYDTFGGVAACIKLRIMFVRTESGSLVVVTCRPDDPSLSAHLERVFSNEPFKIAICSRFIWEAIYSLTVEPLLIEARAKKLSEEDAKYGEKQDDTKRNTEARKVYDQLLKMGIERGASDAHLIPCDDGCSVVYRIDGINYQLFRIPLSILSRISHLLCIDGKVQQKSINTPVDGKIRYTPPGADKSQERDLRFSILPTRKGPDLNVRYLNNRIYTFAELGMSPHNVEKYERILNMPQGLIMQVGPTGSGKSTTLYAGLTYIRNRSLRNIITVEDPVEILMNGITQVDTNDDASLTFARVARQFLRHDVDVGVIGEIRDEETAMEAVRAATTGHLVISSLHCNDSIGVFERLNYLKVDPYTLGEVLVAVMSQRLVRRVCPKCAQPFTIMPDDPLVSKYNLPADRGPITLYKAVGCEHCGNLGYKGRVAVNEILVIDRHLRNQIQIRDTRLNIESYLKTTGFHTLYRDAVDKVLSGLTTLEEITSMCEDTLAYK